MRHSNPTSTTRSSTSWNRATGFPRVGLCIVALAAALTAPLAAGVASASAGGKELKALVPDGLVQAAQQDGNAYFDVIVTGDGSKKADKLAEKLTKDAASLSVEETFSSVEAFHAHVTGKDLLKLAKKSDVLSIVPDSDISAEALDNTQHWDESDGTHWYWSSWYVRQAAPTIAVVDSGVDNSNNAFGGRLLAQFDLGGGQTTGDSRGHGTFVAALAAGAANNFAGTAPNANVVSLDVFDAQGRGTASDVIRAADWILQHKDQYNIRVANFSLQSGQESSFLYDPLDKAVERLWQAGIVVVAAAGNYAENGQASGVVYAPANDPFVITVGATDIHGTAYTYDDDNAPWSAYGYTHDGFSKPELGAPGRYLTEPLPTSASLFADFPNNQVRPGQLQLSGTSFAAPLVSGMAAALLGAHPDWTPDQVKGALMLSAVGLNRAAPNSLGVGEANLLRAFALRTAPPNPNAGLGQFLVPDLAGGALPVFDVQGWLLAAQSNASWNSASWSNASWNSASWNSASWNSASWNSSSFDSASWSNASWNSASWNSVANNAASDGTNTDY